MARVHFRECGRGVSTAADACPNCGAEMTTPPKQKGAGWGALIAALFIAALGVAALQPNLDDPGEAGSSVNARVSTESGPSEAQCRKILGCWGARNLFDAELHCEEHVEHLAKDGYKWTNGFFQQKFDRYGWFSQKSDTLTYYGDKMQFKDDSGAWRIMSYSCDYDPATKRALGVKAWPGRLPAPEPFAGLP